MNRRSLLLGAIAMGGLPYARSMAQPATAMEAKRGNPKITDVQIWRATGRFETEQGVRRQYQVKPLYIYDSERPGPYKEREEAQIAESNRSALYIKILTDAGVEGIYGPIDTEAAIIVDRQLARFLKGRDALAGEALWDLMYRSDRHSRGGHFMMGISAVDNALWDLRGRYYNAPVYRLLGGPTRDAVEAYGSCLGYSVEPERVRTQCVEFRDAGFRYQKWFMAYGPGSGAEGLQANVGLVRNLREAAGESTEFMFDAFMGWDLQYATAWAKQAEQYRPRWIEEAFAPNRIESFARLRNSTSIPVATGEHFYGRWEVNEFLQAQALSVVQADPEWCGGVSELVKICTLASMHDVQVIPHGHALHAALHVVASQSPATCPLVEYLINKMRTFYCFEKTPLEVVQGKIALPEGPGFGIELDEAKMSGWEQMHWG